MELLNSMFLDMDASAEAKTPVERDANTFAAGQRIAIYTKFANVGRTNPGAVEALMDLVADIQVFDASGMLIIFPNQTWKVSLTLMRGRCLTLILIASNLPFLLFLTPAATELRLHSLT